MEKEQVWERYLEQGQRLIDARVSLVDELRALSLSPYMHSVLQTFVAKLAGRIDFQVEGTPERIPLADAVFTTAWRNLVQPTVENALRSYAVVGFAGLFVSPYGVRKLSAEDSTWLGTVEMPIGHVRRFTMPAVDARARYGSRWDTADDEELVDFVEVYLQHEGRLFHVSLSGEKKVVREWADYPYDAHWLFGVERPRSDAHYATGLPLGLVEICRDWIEVQEHISEAARFRMKRARLAQLNVSSLTNADSVESLRSAYRLIPSATPNPLIVPLDEVSPQEVSMFSELAERKVSALSGVGLFDQNVMPRTETATEAMYYAQLGSARAQYEVERVRQWLGAVVQDFRRWLVRLPDEEVPLVRVMVGDSEEVFGRHRHIREALEGMRVTLAGAGWEDVLTRQQKAQMLMQLALAAPQVFDVRAVLEEYLRAIDIDPARYLLGAGVA